MKKAALMIPSVRRVQEDIRQMRLRIEEQQSELDNLKKSEGGHPSTQSHSSYFQEHYVSTTPSIQNVVNIFEGVWMSELPIDGVKSGQSRHFTEDRRIFGFDDIMPVSGKKVLELGPFEGFHSYHLEKLGAASVTSIEGKTNSYIKCLIVKDIFELHTDFRLGNFNEYLKDCTDKYDIVLASGVLYNMTDPVKLIRDISRVSDAIFLWTYYYSEERADKQHIFENTTPIILHSKYKAHKRVYSQEDLDVPHFCGGDKPYSMWLERDDVFEVLKDAGFINITVQAESLDDPGGNYLNIVATKE